MTQKLIGAIIVMAAAFSVVLYFLFFHQEEAYRAADRIQALGSGTIRLQELIRGENPARATGDQDNGILVSPDNESGNADAVIRDLTGYKSARAGIFWVGETLESVYGTTSRSYSYWNDNWLGSFGGIDDPVERCGFRPCAFVPRENPFYLALPYGEKQSADQVKPRVLDLPWYEPGQGVNTLLRGRWLELRFQDRACYGQWQDVGPGSTDDFDYVFGRAGPDHPDGYGLMISPALRDCLGFAEGGELEWRFIDREEVPDGEWSGY